jgi:membrane-anchored glycerophosphoryl diester phosphodiesterase (GDPDase)
MYFIVPVMIFEQRSIADSVKQSTKLIKKTWGESLVAAGGIGAFIMLLAVAGLALPVVAIFFSTAAALVALGVMVVYWIGLSVVSAALSGIFRTALYLYATEGRTPQGFTADYVQHAFAVNQKAATNFSFGTR